MALNSRETTIQGIVDSLNGIITDEAYEGAIASVTRDPVNTATIDNFKCPVIYINDGEQEEAIGEDSANYFRKSPIVFDVICKSKSTTQADRYLAEAALIKWLNSNPTISDSVIGFVKPMVEGRGSDIKGTIYAFSRISADLLYLTAKDSSSSIEAIAHGTDWITVIKDKLIALLNELQTEGVFANVYDSHSKAGMVLNAVSIQFKEFDRNPDASSTGYVTAEYEVMFTVRVHSAYSGTSITDLPTTIMLTAVTNKFAENCDLGGNEKLRLYDSGTGMQEFTESYTVGMEATFTTRTNLQHTQES